MRAGQLPYLLSQVRAIQSRCPAMSVRVSTPVTMVNGFLMRDISPSCLWVLRQAVIGPGIISPQEPRLVMRSVDKQGRGFRSPTRGQLNGWKTHLLGVQGIRLPITIPRL